jgi:hypothetical protein
MKMPSVGSAGREGDIVCMPQSNSNSSLSPASSGKAPSRKKAWSAPENSFHCSAEWHLKSLNSRLACPLYTWGRRLSANSTNFFPSVESIANYFDCNRTTVFRALQELVAYGWAEIVRKEAGKPVVYRLIEHEEWSRNNPDCCTEKDTMPWEGQGDSLGKALYAASGGSAQFLPRQMKGLRSSGFSDNEITHEFQIFLDRNTQKGGEWKSVYYRFRTHLLRLADALRKAAADKNSCSEESHVCNPHASLACDPTRRTEATPTRRTGATQVVEVSLERENEGELAIPATLSRKRPSSLSTIPEIHGRGFPPSKPTPESRAPLARRV